MSKKKKEEEPYLPDEVLDKISAKVYGMTEEECRERIHALFTAFYMGGDLTKEDMMEKALIHGKLRQICDKQRAADRLAGRPVRRRRL